MKRKILSVVLSFSLLACSATPQQASTADARSIVAEKGAIFSIAVVAASASGWNPREVRALADLYTDDATLFPPGEPTLKGKDDITRYWSRTADRRVLAHEVSIEHAEYSGALLYEYGTFSATFETNGVRKDATARYISVWRLDADGQWRKHMDTWW